LKDNRLPASISGALESGATLACATTQRQAAIRAAWATQRRGAGQVLWRTPRVFTFAQLAERTLHECWAAAQLPDRLLPPAAEWAELREWRREAGGGAEARALLHAVRTLADWRIPRTPQALGGSPEGDLLLEALHRLDNLFDSRDRRPLRDWLATIEPRGEPLWACGVANLAAAPREALRRWGATTVEPAGSLAPVAITCAENDDHELEIIAAWCRERLERDPACRLLIVDARLRQRRSFYDRMLSQTLAPSEWLSAAARQQSTIFAVEGGRPFAEFPLIAHALLSLRLLSGRLAFSEVVQWLRLPFLDGTDNFAGAAAEQLLRDGRKLELSGVELGEILERHGRPETAVSAMAAKLRLAAATLSRGRRTPAEWSPRLLLALRQLGWHGSRPLRSDEQQTVARWHALLDEYAALGAWLPMQTASEAVATLADLATERNFDPASVAAPVTLTESHDDPVVRYDAIWVAGLDASQWPAAPRPDVFIPLRLQNAAGIPWASARGQTTVAHRSLEAWRAAANALTFSWARLEGEAQRSASPLLARFGDPHKMPARIIVPLAESLRRIPLETLEDVQGTRVDTSHVVVGGVTPLTLQAECGFHAYAEVRLAAEKLEQPSPGLDPRERGMLLHKALELVWIKLKDYWHLAPSEEPLRVPLVADSVAAAVVAVFRGHVPAELRLAVERERHRLEVLIEALLKEEQRRPPFAVVALEARREVYVAGGRFQVRIDRIDSIEGGGVAILDYKSGEARAPRWDDERVRDPQLLSYLLAEQDAGVQALANVALANGRAKFCGRSSRTGLLPGIRGMDPNKVPAEQIDQAWQGQLDRWLRALTSLAADYIAGHAPVQPAPDVCRNCHLTILCRRVELARVEMEAGDGGE
jgi:ATP-dependent helicase/nuclease subunit B